MIQKIIDRLKDIFSIKSPCCDKRMSSVFDLQFDKLVYTCKKCGKEWI